MVHINALIGGNYNVGMGFFGISFLSTAITIIISFSRSCHVLIKHVQAVFSSLKCDIEVINAMETCDGGMI
jgi:hypothetical protein